jgi:hypothetical protein
MRIQCQFRRDWVKHHQILGRTGCDARFCFYHFFCSRFATRTIQSTRRVMDIHRATPRRHPCPVIIRLTHSRPGTPRQSRRRHHRVITRRAHHLLTLALRPPMLAAKHTVPRTVVRLTSQSLAHYCLVFRCRIILPTASKPTVSKVADETDAVRFRL